MKTIAELVSPAQVMSGEMELTLQNKAGEPVVVKLTALKRSEFMALLRQHPTDWDARLLDRCSADAALLDTLDLDSLGEAQRAAGALCTGLPSAKQREQLGDEMCAILAKSDLAAADPQSPTPVARTVATETSVSTS